MLMDILMHYSDTLMLFYSVMLVAQHIRFYTTGSSRQYNCLSTFLGQVAGGEVFIFQILLK